MPDHFITTINIKQRKILEAYLKKEVDCRLFILNTSVIDKVIRKSNGPSPNKLLVPKDSFLIRTALLRILMFIIENLGLKNSHMKSIKPVDIEKVKAFMYSGLLRI